MATYLWALSAMMEKLRCRVGMRSSSWRETVSPPHSWSSGEASQYLQQLLFWLWEQLRTSSCQCQKHAFQRTTIQWTGSMQHTLLIKFSPLCWSHMKSQSRSKISTIISLYCLNHISDKSTSVWLSTLCQYVAVDFTLQELQEKSCCIREISSFLILSHRSTPSAFSVPLCSLCILLICFLWLSTVLFPVVQTPTLCWSLVAKRVTPLSTTDFA